MTSTTTDVAVPQQHGGDMSLALPSIIGGDMPGLAVLEQWSKANDYAARLVAQWIFTDLVPVHHWPLPPGQTLRTMPNPRVYGNDETDDQYRRRCEIATASASGTVLRGISIGLPPNIALEQMHSIRGTIGMKVKAKYALAVSRGIKAWDVELDDEHAMCAGIHPTTGETVTITITMAQARKAGWTDNAAYGKTPQDMLWARSMGRVLDRIAGHVLFGLPSVEDVEVESRPVEVTAEAAPPRPNAAAILASAGQPTTEPLTSDAHEMPRDVTPPAEPPAPAPVERAVLPITDAQLRKLGVLFGEMGVKGRGERADRLRIASEVVGRPLESSKDLTMDEARMLIDTLEGNGIEIAGQILGWDASPTSGPPAVRQSDDMGGADPEHDLDAVADASGEASWPAEDGDQGWPEAAQPGSQA